MPPRLNPALRAAASYPHWNPVTVRFRDLDLLGHVNNVSLAGWLEDARVALEMPIQPIDLSYRGPVIVLVDLRIQFLAEVHYEDEVRIGTRVSHLGSSSVTIGQGVFASGRCAAVAEVVEVLIGRESRKPEPWPVEFRTHFSSYLGPGS